MAVLANIVNAIVQPSMVTIAKNGTTISNIPPPFTSIIIFLQFLFLVSLSLSLSLYLLQEKEKFNKNLWGKLENKCVIFMHHKNQKGNKKG